MLSPASQPASGEKMHHFSLLFSPKIFKEREIMLFQNRKNKILFGPKILNGTYQNCLFWFRVFSIKVYAFLQRHSREFKYPRRHFALGSISFSMKINDFWCFFMFFACFLNHCKTGVLIFWRSISTKKHRFSRVFRVLFDPLQDWRVDFLTLNFASSFYAQRRVLVHHEVSTN